MAWVTYYLSMERVLRDNKEREVSERSADILATLNERQWRLWAAAEARQIGRGGIAIVAHATGLNKNSGSKEQFINNDRISWVYHWHLHAKYGNSLLNFTIQNDAVICELFLTATQIGCGNANCKPLPMQRA